MGEKAVKYSTLNQIGSVVSEHLLVSNKKIYGKSRVMDIAKARQIAMFIAREITKNSLGFIGKHFGNRDHSTVIHACKNIEDKLAKDVHLNKTIELIKDKLEQEM